MARLQVTCINKPYPENPHTRIQALGGLNPSTGERWHYSEDQVIQFIINGVHTFFLKSEGVTINVKVDHKGPLNLYLKTDADSTLINNLLSLPQCR